MNILIAGAGKVGFNLARTLCVAHNVTVIDRNAQALQKLQESLDILTIQGDIENPLTYKKLMNDEIDLFIAVTDSDEANIISIIIADDTITIKRKFIRLKNKFFAKTSIKEKVGIDKTIFPIRITSQTIGTLIKYPLSNNVKAFKYTDFKLFSIRISRDIAPVSLNYENVAVVGVERGKDFFVPKINETFYPGDLVYLFGNDADMKVILPKLDTTAPLKIQRCVVIGASELGVSIASVLIENNIAVKIIEKNVSLCEIAEEKLEGKATVVNSKYSSKTLYEDEGLGNAEMIIVATENDEYNIIKSIEFKEHGAKKVVAINNESEYYSIMHTLGIIVVRGPKMSAYNTIIENIDSHGVINERIYCGGKAIIYMHKIFEGSKHINKEIEAYKNQDSMCLYILRDEKLLKFDKKIIMKEKDIIISFAAIDSAPKIKDWMYGI
ncbi:NAD-binding protein [bacterium]|nr:NAD-binding protein [bacterium]